MSDRDIIDIERPGLTEPVSAKVGVDAHSGFERVCYEQMVRGVPLSAEKTERSGSPVILRRAVGIGDIRAQSAGTPGSHVVVTIVAE